MNTSKWIARRDTRPVGATAGGMEFAERRSDLEKRLSVAVTAASGRLGNTLIGPLWDLNLPELEDDSRDHGTSLDDKGGFSRRGSQCHPDNRDARQKQSAKWFK